MALKNVNVPGNATGKNSKQSRLQSDTAHITKLVFKFGNFVTGTFARHIIRKIMALLAVIS